MKRRDLMKLMGAGFAASAATRLNPFVPTAAQAQSAEMPKRLLVIFHGLGYLEDSFWPVAGPSGNPDDFTLGATMSALEPYKEHLIYPDGLINYGHNFYDIQDGNNHHVGSTCVFTGGLRENGQATGPSFEQVVADHIWSAEAPITPFRTIALGMNSQKSPPFHRAAGQVVTAQDNLEAAFNTYFANVTSDPEDPRVDDRRRRRQSVLDYVHGDLNRVRNRIGRQEEVVLDAHLEHVRALETRIQGHFGSAACVVPEAPGNASNHTERAELMIDLMVASMACDLARVGTLQFGHCDGGVSMIEGLNAHGTTHAVGDTKDQPTVNAQIQDDHRRIDRWWADRWAYLLGKLASTPEGNGSMLDNTLIVWGSDTMTANVTGNQGPHRHYRFPYFMAGGRNHAFQTGRYLQYEIPAIPDQGGARNQAWQASQQSHARLWVSILQKFGVEVDTFGDLDVGSGTLPGLG